MKRIFVFTLLISMTLSSCGQKINFGKILDEVSKSTQGGLSQGEIAAGLKEALQVGINLGADKASLTDGYFKNPRIKIPFPEDVKKIETTLRNVGLGGEVDKFVLALNRGAEEAAKEAKPIFISAIRQMTITDAINILKGEKDAATQFLKRTTSTQLAAAFEPSVVRALEKTQASRYYTDLANVYNKVPFVTKVNPDLKGYATQKAIDGLFLLVADEEAKIRENPLARTTELLRRVFGSI
ncbi:DUF4197 family protein [Emticicia sp. CRIBPO]|uniref:DUF4197 domain-containing protein n=1 Tax=Emticicia sp. CRIBPO TaxID=2683258 RepID=UPI0014125362|nr:DUF4197 domain-containing protein [Emticicia sp. CRIBPO]NBA84291.1 DUF4197 family protein [Emticicia sp. CRIBPO]